jgi:hypothetical protein
MGKQSLLKSTSGEDSKLVERTGGKVKHKRSKPEREMNRGPDPVGDIGF